MNLGVQDTGAKYNQTKLSQTMTTSVVVVEIGRMKQFIM